MTNTTSPERYAETLLPLLARFIAAVHDESVTDATAVYDAALAVPAPPGVDPARAVAHILAAAGDPTRSMSDMWGWTTGLGGPATLTPEPGPLANPLAVEMALAGTLPAHALADHEAAAAVRVLVDRGWHDNQIREHLQAERSDARRWCNKARKQARRQARSDAGEAPAA